MSAGETARDSGLLKFGADRLPIYGRCETFEESALDAPVAIETSASGQSIVRLGYDLFAEVRLLLTRGQPAEHASIPTLDLHIALLRQLLVSHGVSCFEIPPVPAGHEFVACLTHDVDHPRLRDHFLDHTMFGFLYRALVGSVVAFVRQRKTLAQVARNFRAACSLPFVHLGLAKDFWNQFDRYREIEGHAKSTFFVIPEKGNPGEDANGRCRAKRAARYDLASLTSDLRRLLADGCEIAVHGIDAWRDASKGRNEREQLRPFSSAGEAGIRMHWLYFDQASPAKLEQAGYSYDSTFGYNETIGYRAGTGQVFRPLTVERLLELPMHLMDTAMFYPPYLDLSPAEAARAMDSLIDNAARFGGVLTINWHDRSLAPERQWDASYIELVEKLQRRGAWMPTAADAVAWFRQRRAAWIDEATGEIVAEKIDPRLPGLQLHKRHSAGFVDAADDLKSEPARREASFAENCA